MAKTTEDILSLLKLRGTLPEGTSDEAAQTYIEQAALEIKAYCNIPEAAQLPDGLFYVWAEISAALYAGAGGAAGAGGGAAVASIREGDTTIEFQTAAEQAKCGVLSGYQSALNRYRRFA